TTGPLEPSRVLALAEAILDTLELVHARGYVHRDLKPENIFVGDDPLRARLVDFGLAKMLEQGDDPTLTAPERLLGTPEYMAPEQCVAGGPVDPRSDLYAIGVILYEATTLRPPFFGSRADVLAGHRLIRPPRPSRFLPIPAPLEEVLMRCLA